MLVLLNVKMFSVKSAKCLALVCVFIASVSFSVQPAELGSVQSRIDRAYADIAYELSGVNAFLNARMSWPGFENVIGQARAHLDAVQEKIRDIVSVGADECVAWFVEEMRNRIASMHDTLSSHQYPVQKPSVFNLFVYRDFSGMTDQKTFLLLVLSAEVDREVASMLATLRKIPFVRSVVPPSPPATVLLNSGSTTDLSAVLGTVLIGILFLGGFALSFKKMEKR